MLSYVSPVPAGYSGGLFSSAKTIEVIQLLNCVSLIKVKLLLLEVRLACTVFNFVVNGFPNSSLFRDFS